MIGAVGARAVCRDLAQYGHRFVELERGSTDSKLWKDVKRKRVRIPDLVCLYCGVRIECRAKTGFELSMSHSPTDTERAWDFGLVDTDWVAFPVCSPVEESDWTRGGLLEGKSHWQQKSWVEWQALKHINYFTAKAFRSSLHARSRTKGVEEGSENFIGWDTIFSPRQGPVLAADKKNGKITIARADGSRPYTWTAKPGSKVFVSSGAFVEEGQVIAGTVSPIPGSGLACSGCLSKDHIAKLLGSRERTQRFTGVRLARLRKESQYAKQIQELANDVEEDVYVRLEAASYLVACCKRSAAKSFAPFLQSGDQQTQLEAAIALGEAGTSEAAEVLSEMLCDKGEPFFLRSAAAWSLGQIGSDQASASLVSAFSDVDSNLRFEALDNLVAVGSPACDALLEGLNAVDDRIVAGCAEALRQAQCLPANVRDALAKNIRTGEPGKWVVWLIGLLPRDQFKTAIADLQETKPELHYAVCLLWSFMESWIARNWEATSAVNLRAENGETDDS